MWSDPNVDFRWLCQGSAPEQAGVCSQDLGSLGRVSRVVGLRHSAPFPSCCPAPTKITHKYSNLKSCSFLNYLANASVSFRQR